MVRFTVFVTEDEFQALIHLADKERRDTRSQASLLILQGLQRAGFEPDKPTGVEQSKTDSRPLPEPKIAGEKSVEDIKQYFTERELKEIAFSQAYTQFYNHGTDGHNAKIIIAKLAYLIADGELPAHLLPKG